MTKKEIKEKINEVIEEVYFCDKKHNIRITEAKDYDNDGIRNQVLGLIPDFLGKRKDEFIKFIMDEFAEAFMDNNYHETHTDLLGEVKDALPEKDYEKHRIFISDYIADKLVIGLTKKEWEDILWKN